MPVYDAFEPWDDPSDVLDYFEERFSIPRSAFAGLRWWRRPSGTIWASDAGVELEAFPEDGEGGEGGDALHGVQTVGLVVMRRAPPRGQPSSAFLRRFGSSASQNVLDLDAAQAATFVRGDVQPVPSAAAVDGGVVIVRARGEVLGRGRVRGDELHCELPKEARVDVGDALWFTTPA